MKVKRKIQKIIDGNTFKIHRSIHQPMNSSRYIKVVGLDYIKENKKWIDFLNKNALGKIVSIYPIGRSYGKIVATVPYFKTLVKEFEKDES